MFAAVAPCGVLEMLHQETSAGYLGFDNSLLDVLVVLTIMLPVVSCTGLRCSGSSVQHPLPWSWGALWGLLLSHTGFIIAKHLALDWKVGESCQPRTNAGPVLYVSGVLRKPDSSLEGFHVGN